MQAKGANLTEIMKLFFRIQGTSLSRSIWAVLDLKRDEEGWEDGGDGERSNDSNLRCENLKGCFRPASKKRRLEVEPAVAGDHNPTLKLAA